MVRITIDTDMLPEAAPDSPGDPRPAGDAGAGPSDSASDPAGDSGASDGGGPPLWLIEAVARAEAGDGTDGMTDAGPGPDGGQG